MTAKKRLYGNIIIYICIAIYISLWWVSGSMSRATHYGKTYTNVYGYTYMYSIFAGVGIVVLIKILFRVRPMLSGVGSIIKEMFKHPVSTLIDYFLPTTLIASSILVFALDIYYLHRPYLTGLAAFIMAGSGIGRLVIHVMQHPGHRVGGSGFTEEKTQCSEHLP